MASGCVPDIWQWIRSLPEQWRGGSCSLQICSSPSSNQSLNLVISRLSETQPLSLTLSICAEFHDPISLWSSSYSSQTSANTSTDLSSSFLHDIISGVLRYGPYYSNCRSLIRLPSVQITEHSGKIFNLAAFTLALLVSIYESPSNIRRELIDKIGSQLARSEMRYAAKRLMLTLGSNVEELWMRSLNLGITNWTMESQTLGSAAGSTSPFTAFFSYAVSAARLWKVQVYCPVAAMAMEHPSHQTKDEKLLFSLNYQQLEAVIQFVYRVTFRKNWIDVAVNVDNIRCDLIQLVSEALMAKQGYGSDEKHFPSRISLQLTPMAAQPDVLSLSVSRPTDNPVHEVGVDAGLDATLGVAPAASMGIGVSAHETVTQGAAGMEVRELGAGRHGVAELVPPRRRRRPGGVLQRAAAPDAAAPPAALVVPEPVHEPGPAVHAGRRRHLRRRRVRRRRVLADVPGRRRQDRGLGDEGQGVCHVLAQQEEDHAHGDEAAGVQGAAAPHHSRVGKNTCYC